mmetsp:Transcript_4943/g.13068  ORF Transcript_4943/g.13068 Transcript_4943/m.13068 type:complete len:372 (-) Transcript_4943:577-1692(-)|eukprot:CAMPEP_0198134806 /NCGR_PEP_ID=MMETSP1442-20131203/60264_1 /TAXON_ID= /ORGANISM="Craspedostauros australis, Strain CCMP3328" /LENGTH=371 /DNA_ID=CAMNT_0043795957 /DNA_START=489 /DNA_END=1604 /DNA_ORIENTATION=-
MPYSKRKSATSIRNILSMTFLLGMLKKSRGARYAPIRDPENIYTLPAEDTDHEGTWLQWPHDYGWDRNHVARYESSWVELTKALHTGEKVHIIVYNNHEKSRVSNLLKNKGVTMSNIDFYISPTDDVWVRDNGPIFAFDLDGNMVIEDWSFNGWGNKADWYNDDYIPGFIAWEMYQDSKYIRMVNEGGSIEVDGRGTLMAKRSSILNRNRNRRWTQNNVEEYFRRYLGVTNFIWLDGVKNGDITDDHIDGSARFANGDTIVTMEEEDLVTPSEYGVLSNARDVNGRKYNIVTLPVTRNKVQGIDDYGIYINYYVGNDVVIVPSYNDPNDAVAARVLKKLYPSRTMVLIDFRELYADGGLVHCVTMQQPKAL